MSFSKFNQEDTVIDQSVITAALWTGGLNTLTSGSFYTSSAQEINSNGLFYLNVYNLPYGTSGSEAQFALAYGHVSGSGSAPFNGQVPGSTPTRDVYGQYRNLIYADENSYFNFGGTNGLSRDIYAVNINRARYKESLNVGSLNLALVSGSTRISLTDNSNDVTTTTFIGTARVYNIVSGSNGRSYNSSSVQTASGSYGLFFPDYGTIILNPRALSLPYAAGGLGLIINEISSSGYALGYNQNNATLFSAVSSGASFQMKSQETVSSNYLFVRIKNQEYNYTTNPSVINASGSLLFSSMIDNPQTFITTVGLYNDSHELLAVAKLSKPLPKDFTKEALLRVKLDF